MENRFCGNSSFWDAQLTLNSSWPQFTECFQSTALTFAPAGYLLVASALYIPYLLTRDVSGPMPNTPLALAKTAVSLVLTLATIGQVIKDATYPVGGVTLGEAANDLVVSHSLAYLVARVIGAVSY
ncbi:hypothetical protein EGW08_005439, partial [Elysia chlorotica]